jgi:tetratricopeptide (TPR) repeat protein
MMEEAQKTADELKSITETGMGGKYMRLYYHLAGTIAFKRGNHADAIAEFSKAIDLLPHQFSVDNLNDQALFLEARARAYYVNGDLEKSREDYENIIALTVGRLHWGDIFARSFYQLGKIYEEKGWPGKAIENYERFLDLWKDADPGIPEVDDAKQRLAGLKKTDNLFFCPYCNRNKSQIIQAASLFEKRSNCPGSPPARPRKIKNK